MDPNLSHSHGNILPFDKLNHYNLHFVLTGVTKDDIVSYKKHDTKSFTNQFPNAELFAWPLGLARLSYDVYTNLQGGKIPSKSDIPYIETEILYLNKTSRPRNHRIKLLSKLDENNIISYGINTFLNPDSDSEYKHESWFKNINNIDKYNYNWSSNSFGGITQEYIDHKCTIEIITETEVDYQRFSEKTWKPIINLRPFLILGKRGIHNQLKDLGFNLYDNIFDYSFDNEKNIDDRINGIISNLKNYINSSYQSLYKKEEQNIVHNINTFRKYIIRDDTIDKEFLEQLNNYENIEIVNRVNEEYHTLLTSLLFSECGKSKFYFSDNDSISTEMFKPQII
jgi:hypothetical protein